MCEHEIDIAEYLGGQLSRVEEQTILEHSHNYPLCTKQLEELRPIADCLHRYAKTSGLHRRQFC